MKRYLFCVLAAILICISALADGRTGKIAIAGQECEYDTLLYRKIGPGATYTQLQFDNIPYNGVSYKMRAHLIEVDMNNPYNAVKPYMAKDKYFTVNTQVQQVELEKQQGRKPIASMSGLCWVQRNYSGSSLAPYEVSRSFIRDKELIFESPGKQPNLYYGSDRTAHIDYTEMVGKALSGNSEIVIGQVNHYRHIADEIGKATLFCNGINTSRTYYNADQGVDVLLKKNDGASFKIGQNVCTISGIMDGCCHAFSNGEAILSGDGDVAEQLKELKIGDTITISVDYVSANGESVDIDQQFSMCYTYAVKEGQPVAFNKNTAYPCYGVSKDGKTLYLADLEISPYSNCPTMCMSYLLSNIGVWTAYWGDGGPSAEMTIDGEFVTINSVGSAFTGRYIPDGAILYSIAPDDYNITEIELDDHSPRSIYVGQTLDITTYAYNQYGEMIQKDAEKTDKIELSCTNNLGIFSNGVFIATKAGEGIITVKVAGTDIVKSIPITVSEHRVLTANPRYLFTGEGRECQLALTLTDSEGTHEIKPEDAVWTTNSHYVITNYANGRIVPMLDGMADVYVTYDGLCDTVSVTVENLEKEVDYLDLTDKVGDKNSPYIKLPSVPHSFIVSIKGEPGSIVSLYYTLGSGEVCTQPDTITEDSTASIHVILDYDGLTTYPVYIVNLTSSSKTDAPILTGLIAYYTVEPDGINEIATDLLSQSRSKSIYTLTGQRLSRMQRGINIVNRRKVIAEGVCTSPRSYLRY